MNDLMFVFKGKGAHNAEAKGIVVPKGSCYVNKAVYFCIFTCWGFIGLIVFFVLFAMTSGKSYLKPVT